MEGRSKELYDRLVDLEKKLLEGNFDASLELQSHKSDIERLRDIVEELKSQEMTIGASYRSDFDSFGKDISVTSDKLIEMSHQLDNLEDRIVVLEEHKDKADKRVWGYVEKIVIAIISGIMTMLFNSL